MNLKELRRGAQQAINAEAIRDFVLSTLNRGEDRQIEDFLETEFDVGLQKGRWLFLFDSFDEIPEVLSSVEPDDATKTYSNAIADFLLGMNRCRGIIASREFKGPSQLGWPKLRVLALTAKKQRMLLRKAKLSQAVELNLIAELNSGTDEMRSMAFNPMFLGLLIEQVREDNAMPRNVHAIFERYISRRLAKDSVKLTKRFGISEVDARCAAQRIAFCMTADGDLGLAADRTDIKQSLVRHGYPPAESLDVVFDALEFIKLARPDASVMQRSLFTFAHRRFQEYFATCIVLAEPGRVTSEQLLMDGRWRETAVVIMQTQPPEGLQPLIAAISARFTAFDEQLKRPGDSDAFSWPSKCLHILSLLQDGLGRRLEVMPDALRVQAATLLEKYRSKGNLLDSKWALEVAGVVPPARLESMIRDGLASDSPWIRDTAFRQAARMPRLSEDIARAMRITLIRLAGRGILIDDRATIRAFLSRFDPSHELLQVERFLFWLPLLDTIAIAFGFAILVNGSPTPLPWVLPALITLILINLRLLFWYMQATITVQWFWQFRSLTYFLFLFIPSSYFSRNGFGNHSSQDLWAILRGDSLPLLPSLSSLKQSISEMGQAQNIKLVVSGFARAAVWLGPLWSVLALAAVRDGKFLQPFWWPLMPFVAVVRGVKNLRKVVQMVVVSAGGIVLMFVVFHSRASWWVLMLTGTLATGFLAYSWIRRGLRYLYCFCMDYRRWREFESSPNSIEARMMSFHAYKTELFRARAIRLTRLQGLLPITEKSQEYLRQFPPSEAWKAEAKDEYYKLLEQLSVHLKS